MVQLKEGEVLERLLPADWGLPRTALTAYRKAHLAKPEDWRYERQVILIAKGAFVNARDDNGLTPLHDSAGYGHKETVELLIAEGADVNAKTDNELTPLFESHHPLKYS